MFSILLQVGRKDSGLLLLLLPSPDSRNRQGQIIFPSILTSCLRDNKCQWLCAVPALTQSWAGQVPGNGRSVTHSQSSVPSPAQGGFLIPCPHHAHRPWSLPAESLGELCCVSLSLQTSPWTHLLPSKRDTPASPAFARL